MTNSSIILSNDCDFQVYFLKFLYLKISQKSSEDIPPVFLTFFKKINSFLHCLYTRILKITLICDVYRRDWLLYAQTRDSLNPNTLVQSFYYSRPL